MRPEQTVEEMAEEVLVRQAKALVDRTGQPFETSLESVAATEAGRQLRELANCEHRHEKAQDWQESSLFATAKLGPCQVRSKTEHPCPHQAVMESWGIPFCEACAREQEAYFAIGKAHDEAARVSGRS